MRGEPAGSTNKRTEPERIPNRPTCARVRGGAPPGLGHAVLVARELVGNEPFAVILADDVIDANPPAVRQLIDVFQRLEGPVLAGERVPRGGNSNHGGLALQPDARLSDGDYQGPELVGKPPPAEGAVEPAI